MNETIVRKLKKIAAAMRNAIGGGMGGGMGTTVPGLSTPAKPLKPVTSGVQKTKLDNPTISMAKPKGM